MMGESLSHFPDDDYHDNCHYVDVISNNVVTNNVSSDNVSVDNVSSDSPPKDYSDSLLEGYNFGDAIPSTTNGHNLQNSSRSSSDSPIDLSDAPTTTFNQLKSTPSLANASIEISSLSNAKTYPSDRKKKMKSSKSVASLQAIKDMSKSIGTSVQAIPAMMSMGDGKVPNKPYGGHVEAPQNMIEQEFGSMQQHIKEYAVKKRNKLGRDKSRIACVDIPLQVLRIKDTAGKTHKEHIVSSISDMTLVGFAETATQIIIKFHDNRDYFLTFEHNAQCVEFEKLIGRLRKFNLKMVGASSGNITVPMEKKIRSNSAGMAPIAEDRGMTSYETLNSSNNRNGMNSLNFPMSLNADGNTLGTLMNTLSLESPSQNEQDLFAKNVSLGYGLPAGGQSVFYDDDDEMSVSNTASVNPLQTAHSAQSTPETKRRTKRPRYDTDFIEDAVDDGNVYTGMQTANVVYRITKINKWGTKKERTMIIHKADRTVRLFDDKRRCHSEYPLRIMATLDIIDSLNVEVVFKIDQKPTQFVFRSDVDRGDFVEQIRSVALDEIMVSDRRMMGHSNKVVAMTMDKENENMNGDNAPNTKRVVSADTTSRCEDFDVNPNVLRYSVLRLMRSQPGKSNNRGGGKNSGQPITWRQHRRCIYLDLEKKVVRMLTLGMHIKDYKFEDVLLMEKSYVNANQLHISCRHQQKVKEYWFEFVSPQSRAEFVGRLLHSLPGTKQQSFYGLNGGGGNGSNANSAANSGDEMENEVASSSNPDVITERNVSPSAKKKKKRKRESVTVDDSTNSTDIGVGTTANTTTTTESAAASPKSPSSAVSDVSMATFAKMLSGRVEEAKEDEKGDDVDNNNSNNGNGNNDGRNAQITSVDSNVSGFGGMHLDIRGTEDELNGVNRAAVELMSSTMTPPSSSELAANKNNRFTSDPLSIIVGCWNVSESEVCYANLKMWIPSSVVEPHDIYVIGLQECAQGLRKQWVNGILNHIDCGRKQYVLLNKAWLMGIGIMVIVHRAHVCKISHLHSQVVPTGKGNLIGNKGATAISFQFQETSFAFINAHLAARAERVEKRAKDFRRIIKNLELGRPGLDVLHQFTHTFFIGDLNYRIERDFYETVGLIKLKKWSELVLSDQLRVQMQQNRVFCGFKEGEINFCPTYRWERNKSTVSNKREQPPSYCDRILYKSLPQTFDLWQECYLSSHKCFGSDHRPVWSLFKFKPKMPYFTQSSHVDTMEAMEHQMRRETHTEYKNISISLVELEADFRGLLNPMNSSSTAPKTASGGQQQVVSAKTIHYDDEIEVILHYGYAEKPIRLQKGAYDGFTKYWRWPIEVLDALRLKPFIPDPEFLCRTHILLSFINSSKNNVVVGYAVISLFNAFPKSLVDPSKVIAEYKSISRQMRLMDSPPPSDGMDRDIDHLKQQFISNTASGNKQFDVPILLYGSQIGHLKGFVYADGSVINQHRQHRNFEKSDSMKTKTTRSKSVSQRSGLNIFKRSGVTV